MKTLKFSTSKPGFFGSTGEPLVFPKEGEEFEFFKDTKPKSNGVYIHGEAESLAGYDIPIFLSGSMDMLNVPVEEQDIVMVLPNGEHKCKATINVGTISESYYLTLYNEPLDNR